MERTTLDVTGMSCSGCEETVTDALEALAGVSSATANHETDEVRVEHGEETTVEGIRSTIEDAGYEADA
ncbi:heavy-metal-associated domain-containing protein [Natronococcus jeotgali]|uniref:Heavy metal transport/detoxification protein n=1 Tax=Natronococcus jeotgali DSM 18795 TaxID=1227498 RepID=L9XXE1_9EURY|nr:heavy metal-associated domain-containing protein [Natronococcus jeotgali]ELY66091.1 heavy metal transport/detoxification protein [Natronococcus jeotgali DSM 18795]